MGNILVIPGADFSSVAVETVTIPNEALLVKNKVANSSIDLQHTISSNENWDVFFIPISRGFTYRLVAEMTALHAWRVGVCTTLPAINTVLDMVLDQTGGTNTKSIDLTYTAEDDGYLCWQINRAEAVENNIYRLNFV